MVLIENVKMHVPILYLPKLIVIDEPEKESHFANQPVRCLRKSNRFHAPGQCLEIGGSDTIRSNSLFLSLRLQLHVEDCRAITIEHPLRSSLPTQVAQCARCAN